MAAHTPPWRDRGLLEAGLAILSDGDVALILASKPRRKTRIPLVDLLRLGGQKSICVMDTKGELGAAPALRRSKPAEVIILNPFHFDPGIRATGSYTASDLTGLLRLPRAGRHGAEDE